jgi:hypothetical protein
MFVKQCNIDKTDRIARTLIGAAIFLGALLGMSKVFFMSLGLILIVQGFIGWCSIPYLLKKIKLHK